MNLTDAQGHKTNKNGAKTAPFEPNYDPKSYVYANSKVVMVRWIELFIENRSAGHLFVREHRIADKLL
jgi:hypothetical protein